MSIIVKNLTKSYGLQKANSAISFTIEEGEIVGLLGPNGAGKSTLMKSMVGVLAFDSGEISIDGFDIIRSPIECKKRLGYLAENNPLYTNMYVREFLKFCCDIHQVPYSKIEEVIELTGLKPESHKKIKQLSKGYKQRVGIAQAIIHNPKLLILDEPTNGLDPNQIIEIRDLIQTLSNDRTIILSTHIMQEVEALCSRVILIHKGKIVQDCPISEFKGKFPTLEEAFYAYTHTETASE